MQVQIEKTISPMHIDLYKLVIHRGLFAWACLLNKITSYNLIGVTFMAEILRVLGSINNLIVVKKKKFMVSSDF